MILPFPGHLQRGVALPGKGIDNMSAVILQLPTTQRTQLINQTHAYQLQLIGRRNTITPDHADALKHLAGTDIKI